MSAQEDDTDNQHQPQGEKEGEQPVSSLGLFAPEGKIVVLKVRCRSLTIIIFRLCFLSTRSRRINAH